MKWLLVVAVAILTVLVVADECTLTALPFPLVNRFQWAGTPDYLRACYAAIPFRETTRTNTLAVLRQVVDLYSFTDISVNSGAPYNIQVNLKAELDAVDVNLYASDYDFHFDISKSFNKLFDFHTAYFLPSGYTRQFVLTPYSLRPRLDTNGAMIFVAAPGLLGDGFITATNGDMAAYQAGLGQTVTSINGVATLDFLKEFSRTVGLIKDEAARINGYWDVDSDFNFFSVQRLGQGQPIVNNYSWSIGGNVTTWANLAVSEVANADIASFEQLNLQMKRSLDEFKATKSVEEELEESRPYFPLIKREKRAVNAFNFSARTNENLTWVGTNLPEAEIACYNHRNGQALVMKIRNFAPFSTGPRTDRAGFISTIQLCLNFASQNQIKNLILDVTSNPGGEVWIGFQTLAILVRAWERGTYEFTSNMYPVYDVRHSAVNNELFRINFINPNIFASRVNSNILTDTAFYSDPILRNRGGTPNNFSKPHFYNWAIDDAFAANPSSPVYYFDRIIALTDGLCSSTCAQFLHMLRSNDKARVIGVGGIKGSPLASVSYPGGNVEEYKAYKARVDRISTTTLEPLSSTARVSFNWLEMYPSCSTATNANELPLDFRRITPDARLDMWDSLAEGLQSGTPQGTANAVSLYDAVVPYFNRMPSGLPNLPGVLRRSIVPTLTDFCSDPTPTYNVAAFSSSCVGVWEGSSPCVGTCPGTGTRNETYKIIIPGDGSVLCTTANGTMASNVPCTVDCANCQASWVNTTACRFPTGTCGQGTQTAVYVITQFPNSGGAQCETTNGTTRQDICTVECAPGSEAPAGKRFAVNPSLNCIDQTRNELTAYFYYENRDTRTLTLPVTQGRYNFFAPGAADLGQTTTFLPGLNPFGIKAVIPVNTLSLSYVIDGNVTFNPSSGSVACPDTLTVTITGVPTSLASNIAGLTSCLQNKIFSDLTALVSGTTLTITLSSTTGFTAASAAYQLATDASISTYIGSVCTQSTVDRDTLRITAPIGINGVPSSNQILNMPGEEGSASSISFSIAFALIAVALGTN